MMRPRKFPSAAVPRPAPRPHAAAQQRERELAGEQFVIGEPRPCRAIGFKIGGIGRPMDGAQCVGELEKAVAFEPGGILPFGQIRQAFERKLDRLVQLIGMQTLGQRIDRVDQRQLGKTLRVDDAIRMHHLQVPVVERRGPRHVAGFALRQEFLQIILAGVEIGERQRVGVVVGVDIVGRARPIGRRRAVAVDQNLNRHHRVGCDVGQPRPVAPVDKAGRQMEQKIDDPRRFFLAPQEPAIKLHNLRTDAGEARQRRKQRVEGGGAHLSSRHSGAE